MNGDDSDVRIGIGSLKREVYFQTILVVRCHRRNTCALVSEEQIIHLHSSLSLDSIARREQAV